MSIRFIAKDLYRLHQEVQRLERRLETTFSLEERRALEERLQRLRAERDRMRKILEGAKEPLPYRKPR